MTYLKSCEKCMEANSAQIRQGMGCGFELPLDEFVQPWTPRGFPMPDLGPDDPPWPSTCPGYTVRLPIVAEVARARVHWTKGQLEAFAGREPHEHLLVGIEVMEGSANEWQHAMITPESEGGLRRDS